MLEAQMGTLRLLCFWFAAGISANLFAATLTDDYAVGAEPVIFAMLGGLLGMYVYYWDRMGEDFCRKACMLFIFVILIVIGIFFLSSFAAPYSNYSRLYSLSYPDTSGFLGGVLFGFFMSWVFLSPSAGSLKQGTRREKTLFTVGLILSLILLIIVIVVFSFSYDPKPHWSFDN